MISQTEWDAAVVFGSAERLRDHLFVIQVGGNYGGKISGPRTLLAIKALSRATSFIIPDNLPDSVKPLMPSLVKLVESKSPNDVMKASYSDHTGSFDPNRPIAQPFILDSDQQVLAGAFFRFPKFTPWWWLPDGIEAPERWVAAVLTEWTNVDSERFPGAPQWQHRREWQTSTEIDLVARIQAVRDKYKRYKAVLAELDQEEFSLGAEMEKAVAEASATVRRLLTAQGDELVDEVQTTFEELGFTVTNVDKEITNPGDRREDLRVSAPDRPGWITIVEVRGYKRGAQLNDLMRINRFATRYRRETGNLPNSAWYVVNQYLDQDPTARPVPLISNTPEVETFAEDNGLIIDSRLLFRLRLRVRSGDLQPSDAQAKLINASGLFEE
jgi:hypothetical protein